MERISQQELARLGELAVEAELVKQGWLVGNFNASIRNAVSANGDLRDSYAVFYKNGSEYLQNRMNFDDNVHVNTLYVHICINYINYQRSY